MPIPVGTQLGPHEITGLLGKGGMGEVYRARDTKLKRDVAIKILPDEFSRDPTRVNRFQREAEVLASLNHPNIAAIYDLQEANGTQFLVLELVEGQTLAERIQRGPLPIEEALEIGKHVCQALEAAHERNVVHRDLKPANVKITPDGGVKVLDFGLAKAVNASSSSTLSESPTLTIGATQANVILGTAAYMSPEQARGFDVDARSDTFSFGALLFEMLTGRQAFQGDTVSDVLASVLAREPDFTLLPPNLNPRLHELLQRCFQKNPKRRWQAVGDLRAELETIASNPRPSAIPVTRSAGFWTAAIPWAIATVAVIALVVLAYRHFSEETRLFKLSVPFPEKADFNPGSLPAISPDGRRVAYAVIVDGQQRLWVRDLDSPVARVLEGTEGAVFPFWSPDNRWIGFLAGGKLKKIEARGGPIASICDWTGQPMRGATWNQEDVILFGTGISGLYRVSAGGGTPAPATVLDSKAGERRHSSPWFLPDGRHFLYTAINSVQDKTTIYVADLSATTESKDRMPIVVTNSNAAYAQGYLLFTRGNTLLAQAFNPDNGKVAGEPIHVAEQIDVYAGQGQSEFAVSQTGILAYTTGGAGAHLQLTWVDRSGKRVAGVAEPGDVHWPRISPDDGTVAYVRRSPTSGTADIWWFDLLRGTNSRFTLGPSNNLYPTWAPDGTRIAFYSTPDSGPVIIQKSTTTTKADEVLDSGVKRPEDWSGDTRYLVELAGGPLNNPRISVLPLFGDKKPYLYTDTRFTETFPRVSRDGRWLAYSSNESGREEVYVGTFPTAGGKWQVSVNGGSVPVWSRDGKELYFIAANGMMMAVPIQPGDRFTPGIPKPLFDTTGLGSGDYGTYDVSKDGRFLMPMSAVQSESVPMTVVINWTETVKR
jgi:serine/threonine protein kinase/Tol biopolymer transport system component